MRINNFTEFRKTLAEVLTACSAPEVAVDIVADVDCEGGAGFDALWNCWMALEMDLDSQVDSPSDWGTNVHDCVIELFSELRQPMNFGPGETPRLKLDVPALALQVETAFVKVLEAA